MPFKTSKASSPPSTQVLEMLPTMAFRSTPASRRVFQLTSPPKRLAHNYKVYFPREPSSASSDLHAKYTGHIHGALPNYNDGHSHTVATPPHDNPWEKEPLWIRWTTYTACLMTAGLFWTFYKYREPIYCNERMKLNFLSDETVDDHNFSRFGKLAGELGILEPFTQPFTFSEKDPNFIQIKAVFDRLVKAGDLGMMGLEVHLLRNEKFSESDLKIHPYAITVNYGEVQATQTPGGIAAMLAPRIARKAMNHQGELLNHFVFACMATVPAILFGAVALRSKAARTVAVPYFWYYGGLIGFQNTLLLSRQLNEADFVGLMIMARAGCDISEAIDYRKRQVKEGEELLEYLKTLSQQAPLNVLRIRDIVEQKLGLTPLHKWNKIQRIHAANVEKFVPMVKERLAGEVIRRADEEEPRAEEEEASDEEEASEEDEAERMN